MIYSKEFLNNEITKYVKFETWNFLDDVKKKNILTYEIFKRFLIIAGNADPNIIWNVKAEDFIKLSLKDWNVVNVLSKYLYSDLKDNDLNRVCLDYYCSNIQSIYLTQENIKKLMRTVTITPEYYYEHITMLAPFYNILKKNNPGLKDDGTKLMTIVMKEPDTMITKIENSYNLSSKKVFTLPAKYFVTHRYHFNYYGNNGLLEKYPEEFKSKIFELLESDNMIDEIIQNHTWDMESTLNDTAKIITIKEQEKFEKLVINFYFKRIKYGIEETLAQNRDDTISTLRSFLVSIDRLGVDMIKRLLEKLQENGIFKNVTLHKLKLLKSKSHDLVCYQYKLCEEDLIKYFRFKLF